MYDSAGEPVAKWDGTITTLFARTEDGAVFSGEHHTLMEVPADLVPTIRELIAKHQRHEDNEAR